MHVPVYRIRFTLFCELNLGFPQMTNWINFFHFSFRVVKVYQWSKCQEVNNLGQAQKAKTQTQSHYTAYVTYINAEYHINFGQLWPFKLVRTQTIMKYLPIN